jgi:peptide/nickel transport system substrate-binding protein
LVVKRSVLAALVAVSIVAACGGDDDDDAQESPPAATSAGSEGTEAPGDTSGATPPAGADADRDGTLRYSTYYEPSRFDPHLAANAGDANALFITYDRLVHLDPEAQPVPGLAERWEFSDDGLELTFHLRQGVTFHDGTPFDAEAVKANLDRALTLEGSIAANDLSAIESVEVVDPATVRVLLGRPDAALISILSDRHGAMVCPSAFDDPDLPREPCGAGMYRLVDYAPGDRMIFERFEDYWDPEAAGAARIEFLLIGDATARLNALRTGEIDVATLEPRQIQEAEQLGLTVDTRTTVVYQQMYMARARAPFDDARVRQALNYAVDRQSLVEAIEFGYGEPNSQIFPEGYWAFNEELGTDYYTYDPERARELLADAGYPDGFSFEMLLPTPGTPPALAEALQAQFGAVGIDMTIVQTPAQEVADLFFVRKEGIAMLGVWTGRQDPSMTTTLRWTSGGFSNPGGHSTPEVEELNERARSTVDPDARAEAMHELVAAATQDAFDLVLYNPVSVQGAGPRVAQLPQILLNGKVEFRGAAVAAD